MGNLFQAKNSPRLFGFLYYGFLANTACAGPPYQTDDPEPVAVGEHEVHVAFEQTRTREGTSGNLPSFELNYGAAPNLQIGIGIPFGFDNPHHGSTRQGAGDIELNAKYRFLEETENRPMVSFFPALVLPTGDADEALGNGRAQLFLPLWLQKNWGEWQSNAGGGYWINRAPDARNHWFFGWQLQKRFSEKWTLGSEVFYSSEETRGEGSSSGFNFGAVYTLDEHSHLLISAGRGLANANVSNQFSSYVGYQFNW